MDVHNGDLLGGPVDRSTARLRVTADEVPHAFRCRMQPTSESVQSASCDRRVPDQTIDLRAARWDKKKYTAARGLFGRTLGVIGQLRCRAGVPGRERLEELLGGGFGSVGARCARAERDDECRGGRKRHRACD